MLPHTFPLVPYTFCCSAAAVAACGRLQSGLPALLRHLQGLVAERRALGGEAGHDFPSSLLCLCFKTQRISGRDRLQTHPQRRARLGSPPVVAQGSIAETDSNQSHQLAPPRGQPGVNQAAAVKPLAKTATRREARGLVSGNKQVIVHQYAPTHPSHDTISVTMKTPTPPPPPNMVLLTFSYDTC